jgi:hypothetical protein
MRKLKVNDKVKYKDQIGKVEDIILGFVIFRPKFARETFNIEEDIFNQHVEYLTADSLTPSEKRAIIRRNVESNDLDFDKHEDMMIQVGFLNMAIKEYPNLDFWKNFTGPYKVKSFIWWARGGGKDELRKLYARYSLEFEAPKSIILEAEKLGEDAKIENKITNILQL